VLFFLADLHALNELPEPAQLRERTRQSAAQLLALGVDPSAAPSSRRATCASTPSSAGCSAA
jgi:tryptophanyl-tRNA synthetase